MNGNHAAVKWSALIVLAAVLCALPLLTACDEKGRTEYFLTSEITTYLYSLEESDGVLLARFALQESDEVYGTVNGYAEENYAPDGAFYNRNSLAVVLSADAARDAVAQYLSAEGAPSVPAGGLKILLDYVTMDGRIVSDGEVSLSGGNYVHTAAENGEGELSLTVVARYPYYTAWYAVAASAAVAAITVAAAVVVCAKALKTRKG